MVDSMRIELEKIALTPIGAAIKAERGLRSRGVSKQLARKISDELALKLSLFSRGGRGGRPRLDYIDELQRRFPKLPPR